MNRHQLERGPRGRRTLVIAALVGCLLAGTLLVAPDAAAFPLVATGWITYLAVTLMSRRLRERAARRRTLGAFLRQTGMHFTDRLKAAGGPRWPRRSTHSSTRFRHAEGR